MRAKTETKFVSILKLTPGIFIKKIQRHFSLVVVLSWSALVVRRRWQQPLPVVNAAETAAPAAAAPGTDEAGSESGWHFRLAVSNCLNLLIPTVRRRRRWRRRWRGRQVFVGLPGLRPGMMRAGFNNQHHQTNDCKRTGGGVGKEEGNSQSLSSELL